MHKNANTSCNLSKDSESVPRVFKASTKERKRWEFVTTVPGVKASAGHPTDQPLNVRVFPRARGGVSTTKSPAPRGLGENRSGVGKGRGGHAGPTIHLRGSRRRKANCKVGEKTCAAKHGQTCGAGERHTTYRPDRKKTLPLDHRERQEAVSGGASLMEGQFDLKRLAGRPVNAPHESKGHVPCREKKSELSCGRKRTTSTGGGGCPKKKRFRRKKRALQGSPRRSFNS